MALLCLPLVNCHPVTNGFIFVTHLAAMAVYRQASRLVESLANDTVV